MALLWSFGLPKVENSLYFHHQTSKSNNENTPDEQAKHNQMGPMMLLWIHFHSAYTNPMVLQWSLWYAIALAGNLQVTTYMQVVWKSFDNLPNVSTCIDFRFVSEFKFLLQVIWNGGVDAAFTALAALFALIAGYLHAGRLKSRASLLSLAVLSVLEGGCILLATWTTNIYISYLGYVLFGGLYGFTITVAR